MDLAFRFMVDADVGGMQGDEDEDGTPGMGREGGGLRHWDGEVDPLAE